MTDDISTKVETLREQADAAARQRLAEEQKLYKDGRPIYSDAEHDLRLGFIEQDHAEAFDRLQQRADELVQEQQQVLEDLEAKTPLDELAGGDIEDLDRANLLRSFVREDAETMALADLARRVSAVARGGDKAQAFLLHRYGRQRAADERSALRVLQQRGKMDPERSEGLSRLKEALAKLEKRLNQGRDREIERVREQLAVASEAAQYVRRRRLTHEEKLARSNLGDMRM